MANKVPNLSDLIQRVTASCLLNPLSLGHQLNHQSETRSNETENEEQEEDSQDSEDDLEEEGGFDGSPNKKKIIEIEAVMAEMFGAVSGLKKAYASLQESHCPWDAEKMGEADAAVVAELKKLGRLKEKYKRVRGGGRLGFAPLREAVVPYEAALEELKREVKAKEAEVVNLKEKVKSLSNGGRKKGKFQSKGRLNFGQVQVATLPLPEMFESTMAQVKEYSKSFISLLLSLMRSAHWNISAAIQSIESATTTTITTTSPTTTTSSHHAKHFLESYVLHKFFHGFDHETFYIDGSLSSLLNPEQFRRNSFTQFQDMKSMDPTELLGILPTCYFGKFCSKKYLSIIHPKMEESLFGNLEQHSLVSGGNHPRSEFYGEFLRLAKSVWLLHLLAFAFDPSPKIFMVAKGAEFQPKFMESVVRVSGGRVPVGQIVGFPVSPGFKLVNGSVVKARVYVVSEKRDV